MVHHAGDVGVVVAPAHLQGELAPHHVGGRRVRNGLHRILAPLGEKKKGGGRGKKVEGGTVSHREYFRDIGNNTRQNVKTRNGV